MALATYQVNVYSPIDGSQIAVFDTVALPALQYSRVLNGIGALSMTIPLDDRRAVAMLQKDAIIEVSRFADSGNTTEGAYLARMWRGFVDSDDQSWLVIGAVSLEHLLARRQIDPTDDPAEAGGYSTKLGNADDVMAELVDEQCGPSASADREYADFSVAATAGDGAQVGGRWEYNDNLLDTLQKLARASMMDFRIVRTAGRLMEFQADQIGSDKTYDTNFPGGSFLIFDPEYGNMAEPDFTIDSRQERNTTFLMLRGPEDDRDVYEQGIASAIETIYNRSELTVDGRQLEEGATVADLQTQAIDAIRDNLPTEKFDFRVQNASRDYRALWDLGDTVTVRWQAMDYEDDVRIVEIRVNLARTEEITPIFARVE